MKLLVLGGGAQGRTIAVDLARSLPRAQVRVADLETPVLPALGNLEWLALDASDAGALVRAMHEHDLVVGALPSRLGFAAMRAAIEAGRSLVDVSFSAEDPLGLDPEARQAGVTIVPDCGLAPGLSNLVVGRATAGEYAPRSIVIRVGGVARDPSRPYGYVVTWSLEDLLEEYTRPARIRRGGRTVEVPVFSGLETVEIEGAGTMEAFYSDGLRTLLSTIDAVPEMGEMTLRWPGHAEAVQPLVREGRLVEVLRARCTADPPEDLVALQVVLEGDRGTEEWSLVERYDPESGRTAMARATAYTTAVTARLAAGGGLREPGVQPLERVGRDERVFDALRGALAERGVRLRKRERAGR